MKLPTSLYIHIPWCIRKCPYCDFNSHKSPDHLPEENYVQALLADLKKDLALFSSNYIETIFIGGGTPSLFSASAYESLFSGLRENLSFKKDIEITLEANPGTIEQQRFSDYCQLGINRLSLGIQSFHARHLKTLGRIHDDTQAKKAIETARKAGFDNINIDLMYGLPQQTVEESLADIEEALSFQPEHLSWYQLTIEPNTVFFKQQPPLPSEDSIERIEEEGLALLKQNQYNRYEISAFSKGGRVSQHNLNYWLFGDYYGIGAGAHGKLTKDQQIYRTRKQRQPKDYLDKNKNYLVEKHRVNEALATFEFMLNTTRLEQSIPYSLYTERTGIAFSQFEPQLNLAAQAGFIHLQENTWKVTQRGRRYTNNLQALFLPED